MSIFQYLRYCHQMEYPSDIYEGITYPHAYLLIWLECKRYSQSMNGTPMLPDPQRGYLDQDAELLLAFEVLDECYTQHTEQEEEHKKFLTRAQDHFGLG